MGCTFSTLSGTDAQTADQAYGAYVDGLVRSLEAAQDFPALNRSTHQSNVQSVKAAASHFTHFKLNQSKRSSNYYETHRKHFDGNINGAGTSLKFDFINQRNFTQADGVALASYLDTQFPILKLNVVAGNGKARCIVRVGL